MISFKWFLLKRALEAIPLLFLIIILMFIIIHVAPGDPIRIFVGESGTTPDQVEMIKKKYGLDQPLYVQLYVYLTGIIRFDLGYSFAYKEPVLNLIIERLPNTLLLMGTALGFAVLFGILLGALSSAKPHSLVDYTISFLCSVGYSIPVFWLGQILMLVFAMRLHLFPVGGMTSLGLDLGGIDKFVDLLKHLVLPALALSTYFIAIIARLVRASMLEELQKDYVTAAVSKGLSERTVLFKHALRNALLPVVTMIGIFSILLISGSIMVETVFGWPGLGRLTFDAIGRRDYPLLMGMFVISSIMVIVSQLVVDIAYSILDPRVRFK